MIRTLRRTWNRLIGSLFGHRREIDLAEELDSHDSSRPSGLCSDLRPPSENDDPYDGIVDDIPAWLTH